MNPRGNENKRIEQARKQGFVLGLKVSYKMLRDAKNHQSRKESQAEAVDIDKKEEAEYAAGVLHGLCLKLAEEISKQGKP